MYYYYYDDDEYKSEMKYIFIFVTSRLKSIFKSESQ